MCVYAYVHIYYEATPQKKKTEHCIEHTVPSKNQQWIWQQQVLSVTDFEISSFFFFFF